MRTASVDGMIIARPIPIAVRAAISAELDPAKAPTRLEAANVRRPSCRRRRLPKRSPSVRIVSRRPAKTTM